MLYTYNSIQKKYLKDDRLLDFLLDILSLWQFDPVADYFKLCVNLTI